jgi:hypothetical protein
VVASLPESAEDGGGGGGDRGLCFFLPSLCDVILRGDFFAPSFRTLASSGVEWSGRSHKNYYYQSGCEKKKIVHKHKPILQSPVVRFVVPSRELGERPGK